MEVHYRYITTIDEELRVRSQNGMSNARFHSTFAIFPFNVLIGLTAWSLSLSLSHKNVTKNAFPIYKMLVSAMTIVFSQNLICVNTKYTILYMFITSYWFQSSRFPKLECYLAERGK